MPFRSLNTTIEELVKIKHLQKDTFVCFSFSNLKAKRATAHRNPTFVSNHPNRLFGFANVFITCSTSARHCRLGVFFLFFFFFFGFFLRNMRLCVDFLFVFVLFYSFFLPSKSMSHYDYQRPLRSFCCLSTYKHLNKYMYMYKNIYIYIYTYVFKYILEHTDICGKTNVAFFSDEGVIFFIQSNLNHRIKTKFIAFITTQIIK